MWFVSLKVRCNQTNDRPNVHFSFVVQCLDVFDDPRADELYHATQAKSRKLARKGAGLRRADVEALRSEA